MSETGAVKFTCEHVEVALAPFAGLAELNACRRRLLELGMVGVDATGIGYGNLSVRGSASGQFYITGSGTGGVPELGPEHYANVTAYDTARNWLRCEGRTVASSESLTHAAVYDAEPGARAVIHCHHAGAWKRLLDVVPTTAADVGYGTTEMTVEVERLFRTTHLRQQRIFVMAGHENGLVAFGETLAKACELLIREARPLSS